MLNFAIFLIKKAYISDNFVIKKNFSLVKYYFAEVYSIFFTN